MMVGAQANDVVPRKENVRINFEIRNVMNHGARLLALKPGIFRHELTEGIIFSGQRAYAAIWMSPFLGCVGIASVQFRHYAATLSAINS